MDKCEAEAIVREMEATVLRLGPSDKLLLRTDFTAEENGWIREVVLDCWPDMFDRILVMPKEIEVTVVRSDEIGGGDE